MTLTAPPAGFSHLVRGCVDGVLRSARFALDAGSVGCRPQRVALEAAVPLLDSYLAELVRWNQRVDLTAARTADELVDLFVADAVVLAATATDVQDWVDIGTGPGAPGIPFKLLSPRQRLTLVEPRSKRTAFLRTALGVLELADVSVERTRSDALDAGSHEVAVSRATLAPAAWLAEGARIAERSVWVLLAKGEPPTLPGWQADLDVSYQWPLTAVARRALRYVPGGTKA